MKKMLKFFLRIKDREKYIISKELKKGLVITLAVITVMSSSSFVKADSISQEEICVGNVQILKEENEVFNQEEIEDLMQENEDFSRIYEQQISQGATLEEVTVTTVEVQDKKRAKKNGKIYDSNFRQPVKRKTIYLQKFLNKLSDLNKPT